ncbi:hypothetical protein TIFTF001_021838 [Ficus carica]|uniref:Uncharacterized protein n=1 Tax=Ficus carica TaxID=3494 RepID=A0AA88DEZ5_FICCA|nr:hypothetical protein TIFTF001_021838 [Ficus carica]
MSDSQSSVSSVTVECNGLELARRPQGRARTVASRKSLCNGLETGPPHPPSPTVAPLPPSSDLGAPTKSTFGLPPAPPKSRSGSWPPPIHTAFWARQTECPVIWVCWVCCSSSSRESGAWQRKRRHGGGWVGGGGAPSKFGFGLCGGRWVFALVGEGEGPTTKKTRMVSGVKRRI